MNTTSHESKSDVLHAFSTEANPDADTLARYLKRHPQYSESLIDLSIELFSAQSFDEAPAEAVPSDNAQRAWSTFQSMLRPEDPASTAPSAMVNPLSSLDKQQFKELARELNVNRLFLSLLRDNAIQVATIPRQFLASLAELLNIPIEGLQRVLVAPTTISEGVRYKASGKPGSGDKITFEEALTHSHLSDEQQSVLREMKDL
ncbi:hypothetical protein [Hydrocarboniclastica marina]|uniref:Uncharacterized protein n=1 Tax=Hydrocarboniclastica marina TaxID=2259620 RepID=A0A4P7XH99_9ALTE|nr:hypothetical protein [Hydrocarboniclastica marina]QCF26125.1 hypothetical protein soil367_09380 [Hydrocarboniclastica marina]